MSCSATSAYTLHSDRVIRVSTAQQLQRVLVMDHQCTTTVMTTDRLYSEYQTDSCVEGEDSVCWCAAPLAIIRHGDIP